MKRHILVAALLAVSTVFGAIPSLAAQSSEQGLVKIPFPFIAAGKAMPAGTYLISGETRDWSAVRISSVDGKLVAVVRVKPAGNLAVTGIEPRLWFTNYYGHYFLQKVWMPFVDLREVPMTKNEAERTLTRLNLMPVEGAEAVK